MEFVNGKDDIPFHPKKETEKNAMFQTTKQYINHWLSLSTIINHY